jgi:hypothetical protein
MKPKVRAREFPISAVRFIQEMGDGVFGKMYRGELGGIVGRFFHSYLFYFFNSKPWNSKYLKKYFYHFKQLLRQEFCSLFCQNQFI